VNRLPLALLAATLALAPSATHAATAIWIGPENGSWSDPANWSTGAVPGSMDAVVIDSDPEQLTTINAVSTVGIASLQIDEGDRLLVGATAFTGLATNYAFIAGELRLVSGGPFGSSGLVHISPTGLVDLGLDGELFTSTLSAAWRNEGTIAGAGAIRLGNGFLNEGLITSNVPLRSIEVSTTSTSPSAILLTNSGTLEAANGGSLVLSGSTYPTIVQQTREQARITAGPNSSVSLAKIRLQGGTLSSLTYETGDGSVQVSGSYLDRVTLEGSIEATGTTLEGSIRNVGKLKVLQDISVAQKTIDLSGGGIVQLNSPSTMSSISTAMRFTSSTSSLPGGILRNLDNTIRGRGRIDLRGGYLENRGTIETGYGEDELLQDAPRTLLLDSGGLSNLGTLRSNSNHILSFTSAIVANENDDSAGVIEARPGGIVDFAGAEVTGGVIRAVAAEAESELSDGLVRFTSTLSTLSNVRLEGKVGSSVSSTSIKGKINVEDKLELRNLFVPAPAEIVGGEVLLTGGSLQGSTVPSSTLTTLTLTDTVLRLHSSFMSASRLQVRNNSTIIASANSSLRAEFALINAGLIHAQAGVVLHLPVVQTAFGAQGAELRVDESAIISVPALQGGTVYSAHDADSNAYSGRIDILGISTGVSLDGVTNLGRITMLGGNMGGEIENQGVIEVGGSTIGQGSSVLRLTGGGTLSLLGRRLQPSSATQMVTLINGPDHTISSGGIIDYKSHNVVNQGIIRADLGVVRIDTSSSGSFTQQGTLDVENGTIELYLAQSQFHNDGQFNISSLGNLVISGAKQLNNHRGAEILVEGTLHLNRANLQNFNGATIRGSGLINGNGITPTNQSTLTNQGLIAPGSTVGSLRFRGDYAQTAVGRLEIDVIGLEAGEYDSLTIESVNSLVGGLATLAGTLDFNFAPELLPALGDELVVLTAKQVTGMFDTIEGLPALAAGLDWQIDYLPTMVMATVIGLTPPSLAGDFNGDGFVNLADYTVWRDGLGDTFAASEYDLWKQNFGRSANDPAPEATAPAAVPEPTTALLGLAFVPLLIRRARR
jgi:hypothetical protein